MIEILIFQLDKNKMVKMIFDHLPISKIIQEKSTLNNLEK